MIQGLNRGQEKRNLSLNGVKEADIRLFGIFYSFQQGKWPTKSENNVVKSCVSCNQ